MVKVKKDGLDGGSGICTPERWTGEEEAWTVLIDELLNV